MTIYENCHQAEKLCHSMLEDRATKQAVYGKSVNQICCSQNQKNGDGYLMKNKGSSLIGYQFCRLLIWKSLSQRALAKVVNVKVVNVQPLIWLA